MSVVATFLMLALSRAELIARMKAPVITHADGLVRVYADCPEDMRREYQTPVARFAADTVQQLNRYYHFAPVKHPEPQIVISIGEVRTNRTDVLARATTNGQQVVTRIFLPSPGFADLVRFRTEVVRAYCRARRGEELSPAAAEELSRLADPRLRTADERRELEAFLREGRGGHERGLELMRKVIEPGRATRQDVLIFASRLFLYPPYYGQAFVGGFQQLSFREALDFVKIDPRVRVLAYAKAGEMPAFGAGRSPALRKAAYAYMDYLFALSEDRDEEELRDFLEKAEGLLNEAYEQCSE